MSDITWRESDFEKWFTSNPVLPGDERLLVVAKHRGVARVVDLICLDGNAAVVIIEVKNEATTRRVIGQALEYLASTIGQTVGTLSDDYKQTLTTDFEAVFGTMPAELSPARRVILVAPAFDAPSSATARWLSDALKPQNVSIELIEARREGDRFSLKKHEGLPFAAARTLERGPAITPRGRVHYVLQTAPAAVLWHVGRHRGSRGFMTPRADALTTRGVMSNPRLYLATAPLPPEVDISLFESTWRHRKKNDVMTVLGTVREGSAEYVVGFRTRTSGDALVSKKRNGDFQRDWEPATMAPVEWSAAAALLQRQRAR